MIHLKHFKRVFIWARVVFSTHNESYPNLQHNYKHASSIELTFQIILPMKEFNIPIAYSGLKL